jgi:hypothetical protein
VTTKLPALPIIIICKTGLPRSATNQDFLLIG